jgi:hypothetical protein
MNGMKVGSAETFAGIRCRFGCPNPIGIYHIPDGCVCWTDPVQALCSQHLTKVQSTGSINLILSFITTPSWDQLPVTIKSVG